MSEPSLLMICMQAFMAVMVILFVLTGVLRLLIVLFPERKAEADSALMSAIAQAVQSVAPGATVTHIEEIR
jgi:hypothetical protein